MKQLPYILAALLLTVARIAAHEVNASSSKAGIFGIKPESAHVLLNPLPVYGLGIGIIVLWIGFLTRNMTARKLGLIITAVCATSAWPVLYYGQHAYNSLAPMLDTESEQWLDIHMQRAERFIYGFYATAALAIASVAAAGKWPRTASALAGATLVLGTASLGLGAWISRAGGQVSHSEFRA